MANKSPSTTIRAALRRKILARIQEMKLTQAGAAEVLGLTRAQMSRLSAGEDLFSLERLIDTAACVGLTVRLTATRPYQGN
jgi:predicted XRE-type DNA-binding protein